VSPRAGLDGCGNDRPASTGIRSPERPAGGESLCRLSYPGHLNTQDYRYVIGNRRCEVCSNHFADVIVYGSKGDTDLPSWRM